MLSGAGVTVVFDLTGGTTAGTPPGEAVAEGIALDEALADGEAVTVGVGLGVGEGVGLGVGVGVGRIQLIGRGADTSTAVCPSRGSVISPVAVNFDVAGS